MTFNTAAIVEDTVYTMRLGDYSRGLNRARIDDLFNGVPPYSDKQAKELNMPVNINFLESTRLAHDARRQFANGLMKPGKFFTVNSVDYGPKHKRKDYAISITNRINRLMKNSLHYFEGMRSTFANVVLHGIGPNVWADKDSWCPDPLGVCDVMIPGGALLTMKNLPFFAVFRPYTAYQLYRLTHGPKVDKGWNMPMVERAIKWADDQKLKAGLPQSEIYSPERLGERFKEDSGFYASDHLPTIDAWDFYFWNDENKQSGWNRRIILDAQWDIGAGGISGGKELPRTTKIGTRGEFLYDSGNRKYASKISEIIHFQFGDLSAVAPFRYHSVRSLGFLLFGICHLQNRLRCSFNSALFEQMLQYFRVRSLDDFERTLKINLVNQGFIDETVQFIPQSERWQLNAGLVEMGLSHNRDIILQHASSFMQDSDRSKDTTQKTATQTMAEIQAVTSLVSAALMQAYEYEKSKDIEICRRFCLKNSRDADVREFRNAALKEGIPEEALDVSCWDVEPDRVMGGGNKILETSIANQLMAARNLYDPEPQRDILRDFTLAITDDPARTERLVPEEPLKVTSSVHDAQLSAGTLMMGLKVDVRTGQNSLEVIPTLLQEMLLVIQKIEAKGGVATQEEILGLNNLANYIDQHIQLLAQDPSQKAKVKEFGDDLGKMMNMVKAYEQRLAEQQQAKAQQNGQTGPDPKDLAKIQGMQLQAQAKAENTRESHAQRTAQRQVQFEMGMQQDAEKHAAEMAKEASQNQLDSQKQLIETQTDIQAKDLETASNIRRSTVEDSTSE